MNRSYPTTRLRRIRMSKFSRNLTSENFINHNDLIWPAFIINGKNQKQEVKKMPLVYRYSIDQLLIEVEHLVNLGLQAIALFPQIEDHKKDEIGSEALNPNNLVCNAVRRLKTSFPDLGIICDVALDPYTNHGHDGVIDNGQVDNDKTISILKKQAVVQAQAGCDIIAPSDMMDGRIIEIRNELEINNFKDTMIMSYSAKYASSYYGPFRDAINSKNLTEPSDKKSYQMNPANSNAALHEVKMDLSEGADMIIIKPGMPYLDIISKCKSKFKIPVFGFQVSGEYSMLMAAAKMKYLNLNDTIIESLICFKRAGADGVFSYFTPLYLEEFKKNT